MRYVHYAVIVVIAALLTASAPPRSVARPSDPAGVASGEPAACSPAERARRARAATALARALPIRRRAFFRAHRGASARRAFVRREAARLARLRRLAAACRPSAPPPPAPAPPPEHPQPFTFWPQAGILFG